MKENRKKTAEELEIEQYTNRSKSIEVGLKHQLNTFREEIINGLGDEIKENLETPPKPKKLTLLERIKNLFI